MCDALILGWRRSVCVWRERKRERTSGLPPTVTALRAIIIIFGGEKKRGRRPTIESYRFLFAKPKGRKTMRILYYEEMTILIYVCVCVSAVCVRSHMRLWENFYYYYYYYIMTRWIIRNCRSNGQFLAQSTLRFVI